MSESEGTSSTAPESADKEQAAKKTELRGLKIRIKEIRDIVKVLTDKRKDLEARETVLAADLGRAVKVRKGKKEA